MKNGANFTGKIVFWDKSSEVLFQELESSAEGLLQESADERFDFLENSYCRISPFSPSLLLFIAQFKNSITLILLFSVVMSMILSDATDGFIILGILLITGLLGFWQERGAERAVEKLTALVKSKAKVMRSGKWQEVPSEKIVPGDIIQLTAGDLVPGDCRVLDAKDLFVDESPLTGETFPAEKHPGVIDAKAAPAVRTNALYFGTHVVSGMGRALVVRVGDSTTFGEIRKRLALNVRTTGFQQGVAKFGAFLAHVTFFLVCGIFFLNVYFQRSVFEALLFSLALAVGLTPQLLPAVISVNLAYGARMMAAKKVIVRRLASIENFGSMDVLCSDKTGTLTTGKICLKDILSPVGNKDKEILKLAFLNASFQTGFSNPLDSALIEAGKKAALDIQHWDRLDEVPYDFLRKRLSILVHNPEGQSLIITKGAFFQVLEVCQFYSDATFPEMLPLTDEIRALLLQRFNEIGDSGARCLGIAFKTCDLEVLSRDDEREMVFLGFLIFEDTIRSDTSHVIKKLEKMGVSLKIITGDNSRVARSIALQAGLSSPRVMTGPEIQETGDGALIGLVEDVNVFAEVEPNQKEKLVLALRKRGHIVGYIGDGINDISALAAADIGISVDGAVDAAKQAADMILLEQGLDVLLDGVFAGRRTFANTMKYIFMATSANFGNMFSMACAALFLPFLPLLPSQILLVNVLTDLPEMMMSSDEVDIENIEAPQRWNIKSIRSFMVCFGLLSSIFDVLTFVVLTAMGASQELIRTGWFIESVVSASLIVLLVRTRGSALKSRPSFNLTLACFCSALFAIAFPFSSWGQSLLNFVAPPPSFLIIVFGIVLLYMISVEAMKRFFYGKLCRMEGISEKNGTV